MIQPQDVKDLELTVDRTLVVRPVFALSLFTDQPFTKIRESVIACHDMFLKLCPPDKLKHYLTETMDQHQRTTARSFTMLPTWLKKGAPAREEVFIEFMSSDNREEAPEFRLVISGNEDGSIGQESGCANTIHMSLPVSWGVEHADRMRDMMIHLGGLFPYTSGHAGFALEWSGYFDEEACSHAFSKGMRHPGFDIFDNSNDEDIAGSDSLKTVGWITLLGAGIVKRLGGRDKIRAALPERIRIREVGDGLMIETGDAPEIGDTNRRDPLPAYREVYKLVEPIAEAGFERSGALEFHPGDEMENTLRWLRRLGDKA